MWNGADRGFSNMTLIAVDISNKAVFFFCYPIALSQTYVYESRQCRNELEQMLHLIVIAGVLKQSLD